MKGAKRILVIDDSPLIVDAVRDALDGDGIEVEGVGDAAELEAASGLDGYDLILIDVEMPAMVGDDVAVLIRQRSGAATPIVLLSSLPEAQLAARAHEAGLDGYILKHAGVDGVADEVRAWLDGRKRRRDGGP